MLKTYSILNYNTNELVSTFTNYEECNIEFHNLLKETTTLEIIEMSPTKEFTTYINSEIFDLVSELSEIWNEYITTDDLDLVSTYIKNWWSLHTEEYLWDLIFNKLYCKDNFTDEESLLIQFWTIIWLQKLIKNFTI